ncbi:homocitrate synthase [Fundidesulfovibrio butyratiphilus]
MRLIDTTLREGEQGYGIYFSPRDKRDILTLLARTGVEEAEIGVAGRDEELAALAAFARSLSPRPALSVWTACRAKDLDQAKACAPDTLHMGLPVSDAHMTARLGLDRGQVLELLAANVAQARSRGFPRVSIGLEDASRADADFVFEAARTAAKAGACRVRLSDTVGVWSPADTARAVTSLTQRLSVDVGVHCHNDFGMGTANAVAGLMAGAAFADGSALGLGERAGLAATEELAAYLALRLGKSYDLEALGPLCRAVAKAAGLVVSDRKPVVGGAVFACETGLHVHALCKNPALFEPFDPQAVGAARTTSLGKKSGRAAVAGVLARLGLDPAGCDLESLVDAVRARSNQLGRPLTDAEAKTLLDDPANKS